VFMDEDRDQPAALLHSRDNFAQPPAGNGRMTSIGQVVLSSGVRLPSLPAMFSSRHRYAA
jgi:hypothetical protein